MDFSIVLTLLIATILIVLLVITFLLTVVWERNNKLKKLKHNLSYFPPEKLANRLGMYLGHNEQMTKEVSKLEEEVLEAKRDYIQVNNALDKMKTLTKLHYAFSFIQFRKAYLDVFNLMSEYQSKYLDVRFVLFDLTSDIEIEKAVLKKLKDQASHISESIDYSPIERIRESKKLEAKITKLRTALKKLEELVDQQVKQLTAEFIEAEEKISDMIESIANDVDFMNEHIKHLDEQLHYAIQNIVETYKKHEAILVELKPSVVNYTREIKALKVAINSDIDNIKTKDAIEKMSVLNAKVNELHSLIHSNIDYAEFNLTNDWVPYKLLEFAKSNQGMFESEIKRHRLQDEQARLLYVQQAYSDLEASINKYSLDKLDMVNKHAPAGIHHLLMQAINYYKTYIDVVTQNVKDISEVNASTNDVNMMIARMNTLLLQVEYNIGSLEGLHRDAFEKEKETLQTKVKELRDFFKDNTRIVDDKAIEIVNKVRNRVDKLVVKSKGVAFEIYFIKETIMYLNRFKGSNKKLDLMIESVAESYGDEKYTEALRKAKEIIEIYGIK